MNDMSPRVPLNLEVGFCKITPTLLRGLYPCEMELRIPRIFLRIPKNLFLGILRNQGVKFHGNWNMEFLRIPRNSKLCSPMSWLGKYS